MGGQEALSWSPEPCLHLSFSEATGTQQIVPDAAPASCTATPGHGRLPEKDGDRCPGLAPGLLPRAPRAALRWVCASL